MQGSVFRESTSASLSNGSNPHVGCSDAISAGHRQTEA